ncbi:LysE family translocator [Amycolatopsis arida]|uniref:LysE family translocator n=1 Tax=Amycolatopsis arida TaxID=587909 RepID=UPI000B89D650|nr:LysE family translocator [Amycolatopsis arida]
MDPLVLLGFAVACVVLNALPGPGMLFILSHGVAGGRAAGLAAALGMATGTVVHTAAAALGLSALLRAAPVVLDVLRVGGAAVLIYLAISALRSARGAAEMPVRARRPLRQTYLTAVLTNLANPKVVLFYLAFVPQFVTVGGWPASVQTLVLGGVLIVIGLVMDGVVGLAAGTAATLLRRPPVHRWLRRLSAAIFGGLAVRLLTDTR